MAKIFLALPSSGQTIPETISAVLRGSRKHDKAVMTVQNGYIPQSFNVLWCEAYNSRETEHYTHFSMLHSDIRTEDGYLDTLVDEMDRVGADILSVVIPIGDERGLASTGIIYPGTWNVRRMTMTEVYDLPETFSIADTAWPDQWLGINTGMWICRMTDPWIEDFPGFRFQSRLVFWENKRCPIQFGEDWDFSGWAAKKGLKVFATHKVKAWHRKPFDFPNDSPWGTWTEDEHRVEHLGGEHANGIMASSRNNDSG